MNDQNTINSLLSRASNRLIWLAVGAMFVLLAALVVLTFTLKDSVDEFHDKLKYRPPQSTAQAGDATDDHIAHHQTVYVPAYSHVYIHEGSPYSLTATLSVRNTDLTAPITIRRVRYHDNNGRLVEDYLKSPLSLGPLSATEFLVEEKDTRGGAGANFIVEWSATKTVTTPIIQAVMIGASGNQGISFICDGHVIVDSTVEEKSPASTSNKD